MDVAFKRVGPGEEVPPPPKELAEWAGNTAGGTLGGMVYGAVRGYRAADPKYADVAAIVAKRHRWMRATSEATYGGLRLGSFVALFSAVQLASASHRGGGTRDMWDTVVAGTITAGATGLALPGGIAVRLKGLGLGILVGGGLCVPLGFVTQELDRMVPNDVGMEEKDVFRGSQTGTHRDLTGDVIKNAEAELRRNRPRRKRWILFASKSDD
jgi:hypothetical protein